MSLLDKYIEIPISKLTSAQWNYKKDDDKRSLELMENLKANIARNGQIENLIVRPTDHGKGMYEVVNGNHRLSALKSLKIKKAVCFNLGKISQAHAERIALETNETKFEADPLKLAGIIRNIAEEFDMADLIATMPMSEDEMTSYTKLLDFDWTQYDPGAAEAENSDNEAEGGDSEDGEWETRELRLPEAVAVLWDAQLDRIKKMLYPKKDPDKVSDVPAVECMVAHMSLIPDDILKEEGL